MNLPPVLPFETERLAALESYHIMDSEREKEYDDIAELASYICGTPVSLVTFIDDERQWFKAAVGTEFTENTRDGSFCTFVLPEPDELLMIPDATADERFHNNPLVINSPNVKFYAGVSLKSPEGLPIGTLCVLDVKPNQLTEQQQKALRTLAGQTSKLLELRRKNIEIKTAAKQNQTELQAKIDERTTELKDKNFRLERANEEIQRMVYVASHDLKEPVRKLKIYTDMLANAKEDSRLFGQALSRINRIADHILNIISDINNYSTANLLNVTVEKISLNELLGNTLNKYADIIGEKSAEIQIAALPEVSGSKKQLQSVFDNLLHNSLKYSDKKPLIKITSEEVSGADIHDSAGLKKGITYFCITFTDNGIGFEDQYSDKIFDFFQRLHTRQEFYGNGIGLSIVKKVITNHNGRVTANGTLGKGATFTIFLPKK